MLSAFYKFKICYFLNKCLNIKMRQLITHEYPGNGEKALVMVCIHKGRRCVGSNRLFQTFRWEITRKLKGNEDLWQNTLIIGTCVFPAGGSHFLCKVIFVTPAGQHAAYTSFQMVSHQRNVIARSTRGVIFQ